MNSTGRLQIGRGGSADRMVLNAETLSPFNSLNTSINRNINTEFAKRTGSFIKLKNLQHFYNLKFTGELTGSLALTTEEFPGILEKNVEEGGYSTKQVFNIDETGCSG
jgi:hypothetical protein